MKPKLMYSVVIPFICFLFANICAAQDSSLIAQIQPWDSISETALSSRFGSHLYNGTVKLEYSEKFETYVYVVTERVTHETEKYTHVSGPPINILNQITVSALNGDVLRKQQVRRRLPLGGCPPW